VGSSAILALFCRSYRVKYDLSVGRLRQGLRDFVAISTLFRVVAATLLHGGWGYKLLPVRLCRSRK
jgi:hypothetical protein